MTETRVVSMRDPEEQRAIMEGRKFCRPFGEVVGSFLASLRNQGLFRGELESTVDLLDSFVPDWKDLHVVNVAKERSAPKVRTDPKTGRRILEFSEAQAVLDQCINAHATAHGVDYSEAMSAVMSAPDNAELVAAYNAGPSSEELNAPEPVSISTDVDLFDPGVNLDVLTREIQERDGLEYEAAFAQACEENPKWARAYARS